MAIDKSEPNSPSKCKTKNGIKRKASKINKLIRNNGEKSHPSQAGFHQILCKWVHFLESFVACKKGPKMYNTKEQPEPNRPNHQHQRVPNDAQRKLRNVKRQRVGLLMKPAVSPDKPCSQAHEKRRTQ